LQTGKDPRHALTHPDGIPHSDSSTAGIAPQAVRWALVVIVVATVLRLVVAALLPLGEDEAYAIGIARQFSLSYYDHPPLHFWLVGGWAKLWGDESLWLLRLPFVALAAMSSWLVFVLTRRLFGDAAAVWAVVLFNVAPVFGVAHGTLVLPDGPLLAASLGVAVVLARIVSVDDGSRQLGRWALAGGLAGLALLSKYHGVLLIAGALGFLLTTRRRRWLATPGPWLAAAIAVVMFTPVIVWNWQNEWASFVFQAGRGDGTGFRPLGLVQSLGGQAAYLLPWFLVAMAIVWVRALLGGPKREGRWLLACLATLPIVIFTGLTLRSPGLPHWPMPGWVFVLPLLGEALAGLRSWLRAASRAVVALTAVAVVGLVGVGIAQARWGLLDLQSDPTALLQPWDELKGQLAARGLPADERTFIATRNWRRAGQLNTLFGKDVPVLCLCGDPKHFAYAKPPADYAGWTGILIDVPVALRDFELTGQFAALTPAEDVSLTKAGKVMYGLDLRVGTGFRP
jgi:4-amino-4-deoxy-L-arabinose transferase-like glycosyltransferase